MIVSPPGERSEAGASSAGLAALARRRNEVIVMTADKDHLGGIIHVYQKYDPVDFPSPTAEPPDLVSPAMEHMLAFGSMRELSEEDLARAIHLDPRQIANLGPSLDALMAMLNERKRRILETYETESVQLEAERAYRGQTTEMQPPG